jgi:hypothetical protein
VASRDRRGEERSTGLRQGLPRYEPDQGFVSRKGVCCVLCTACGSEAIPRSENEAVCEQPVVVWCFVLQSMYGVALCPRMPDPSFPSGMNPRRPHPNLSDHATSQGWMVATPAFCSGPFMAHGIHAAPCRLAVG